VQVIGRIAAGGPIDAVDLPEEYVPVPPSISNTHEHFALEVIGDSMIGKAIISGDRECALSRGEGSMTQCERASLCGITPPNICELDGLRD
jgi:hypothetical protein